jgi:hypothetical protein
MVTPFLSINSVQAVPVDSEILLLVDVSKGLTDSDFSLMTQGIADSFRSSTELSSTVIDSIQSGKEGSIAISLVFWAGNNKQQTAVTWANISDSVSAEAFALSVENATRPWDKNKTALGDAIRDTTTYFGTETGGAPNGFESAVQIVNVIGGGEDNNSPPGNNHSGAVADARDLSLASGADVINAIAVTQDDPSIASYYDSFVVGGTVGTMQGSTSLAADYSSLATSLAPMLTTTISQAAATTVPEPATSFLLATCFGLLIFRRR